MPDLATLRKQLPGLEGLDDASAVDVLHQVYYPDLPIERVQQAVGYTPPPPEPDGSSNVVRGAKVALGQTMPLVKGVVGLAGATAENALGPDTFLGQQAGKVKNWGLSGYQEGMAKLEPMARENDDVTVAWKKAQGGDIGALLDWAQYGIGYALGQGGEAIATSLLGGVAGAAAAPGLSPITGTAGAVTGLVAKGAVKSVARNLIEKAVVKEANRLMTETAAAGGKITAEEATKQATKAVASEIGQTASMLAYGNVQELGSIYPDAEQNARQAGAPGLDGSGLARVWGWGLAAGGLEGLTEKLGVDVALGKAKLPGAGTRLGQGAMQGAAGALVEGGTEAAQTVMEHAGAGEDLWDSAKQQGDIINSSALGALGGLVIGGAAGLLHGPRAHARQQAQQLQDKVIAEIGAAPDADSAIAAFTKAVVTPITVPPGFDADAAMGRLDQLAQADAKSMRQGTGAAGSGVPEMQRELAAQTSAPAPASGNIPTAEPATGSAQFVPVEEFGDRLITLRDKLEQPRVRQQIRDVLGDAALGDILYYARAADNPNLPGTTSDRMLQVAEVLTDRALAQPTGPQAKVETAPGVPALPAPPAGGNIPTPALSGAPATMRVNAAGEAAPETPEQAKRTAARQTQDFQLRGEPQHQPGGLPAPGATPLLTVDEAAHQAAPSPQNALPEPTQAQKEAGNYQKGHVSIGGLPISVENPQGSVRSGVDKNGKPWSNTLRDHYGYIRGTTGADGDHVDTFIKAGTPTDWNGPVFVVDQRHDNGAGKFDEVKAMLGYGGELEARAAYLRNYHRGWTGGTHIRAASFDAFKAWLADPAATRRPFAEWQGNGSTQRPPEARPLSTPALQDVEQHEGALPQSEGDGLRELRRPGDQGGAGAGSELHGVPGSGGRAANAEASARPGEQRPGLRAGQSALDDEARAGEQPAQERAADARGTHADAGAVGGGNRAGTLGAALPDQRGAHERGGSADNAGTRGTTQGAVAPSGRAWWEAATPEQRADMMRRIGKPEHAAKAAKWDWLKLSGGMRAAVMTELGKRASVTGKNRESKPTPQIGPVGNESAAPGTGYVLPSFATHGAEKTPAPKGDRWMGYEIHEAPGPRGESGTWQLAEPRGDGTHEILGEFTIGRDQQPRLELRGGVPEEGARNAIARWQFGQIKMSPVSTATPAPAPAPAAPKVSANTIITDDAYQAARARLKAKLGRLSMGVDPEMMLDGITTALYHIEKGARTFAAYAKAMVEDLGEGIRPYLKSLYMAVKYDPRATGLEGMSSAAEVEAHDTTPASGVAADTKLGPQHLAHQLQGQPHERVAQDVTSALNLGKSMDWRELVRIADEAYGGTMAEGKYTIKDAYDAMEAGMNHYILGRGVLYGTNVGPEQAIAATAALEKATSNLPTQTKRTAEQDAFQQFSTPPAFAYVANWVANPQPGESYLEPSAGVGGLAVFGQNAGARLTLNELAPRRAEILQSVLPQARVFTEDAEQLNNLLPEDVRPSVIVMNPPFSSSGTRGVKDSAIGANHIKQALLTLQPGGRLVAIVGGNMTYDAPAFQGWWKDIKQKYRVQAAVGVEGRGYAKYGTTFGNVLIVIDKLAPQGKDVVTGFADSYTDLIGILQGVRSERAIQSAEDRRGAEPDARGDARERPVPQGKRGAGAGTAAGSTRAPVAQGSARGPVVGGSGAGGDRAGLRRPAGDALQPGADTGAGSGELAHGSGTTDEAALGVDDSARHAASVGDALPANDPASALTDSVFEEYKPQRLTLADAQPHPGALVQSAAMASVMPPATNYKPNLPAATVKEGKLSIAQLEAVTYAGAAHAQMLPSGERRGFFIGDGTGVGKGREIGGIILDNLRQGRKKHIWISEKQGLLADAQRDFKGVGGDPTAVFNQNKTDAAGKIDTKNGVLFTTYATLRSSETAPKDAPKTATPVKLKTRLEQIVEWAGKDFDGVIAFDEAHNAGNAIAIKNERGWSDPSAQALAVVELQKALPNARIVYVSATGATEVSNLSFATRLGLWGEGTPFPKPDNFINEMTRGGLATMELVARDMKQMGAYTARSLSFNGVSYRRLEHNLTDLQRDIYNRLAEAWQVTLKTFGQALEAAGATENGKTLSSIAKRNAKSAYWSTQQRFFNQVITSMQMPSLLADVREQLAQGKAIVIQLVNTNEAQQERALAKRREDGDSEDLEDLDLTPRDQLMQMVEKSFPTQQYQKVKDPASGKTISMPVKDSQGNFVQNKEALLMKAQLLNDLQAIRVPDGPLELLLNEFGPDVVAEVTGRKQRVVRKADADGNVKATLEKRGNAAARADADAFMADKKRILVFSDAGGTGYSFHADLTKKNQRQREHYLAQPGWRANKAVQGLGRTHRTNQASAPRYTLASTDIPAHARFLSAIARRLDQLGALTTGQRDTSSGGLFNEKDNLESQYAERAVRQLIDDVRGGQLPGVSGDEFLTQLGLDDIVNPDTGQIAEGKYPPVRQFLNRMLSLTLDMQNKTFDAFISRMEEKVEVAAQRGELDTGLQSIKALSSKVVHEATVYTDPRTGAETKYVELELTQPTKFYDFPEDRFGTNVYYKNETSGRVWVASKSGSTTLRTGAIEDAYAMRGTGGVSRINEGKLKEGAYAEISEELARAMWNAENAKRPTTHTERAHMLVGALLPIWDRLPQSLRPQVVRVQTVDGRRLLGRRIFENDLSEVLDKLEVKGGLKLMPAKDVMDRILGGQTAQLVNGTRLVSAMVTGEKRIEILQPQLIGETTLREMGAISERINWNYRYFVPTGGKGVGVMERLLAGKPLAKLGVQDEDGKIVAPGPGDIANPGTIVQSPDKAPELATPMVNIRAPEMQDARTAAAWLAKNGGEPWIRAIAEKLAGVIHEGVPIHWLESGKSYTLPRVVHAAIGSGSFGVTLTDSATGKNSIFMRYAPSAQVNQAELLHELLHAGTQRAMRLLSTSVARADLENILRAVRSELDSLARDDRTSEAGREAAQFFRSVVNNTDELLAYGLTSPTFRKWAQSMSAEGRFDPIGRAMQRNAAERQASIAFPEPEPLTLWQRFVDAVRRLIGLSKVYQPRLEAMLDSAERARHAFVNDEMEPDLVTRLDQVFSRVLDAESRVVPEDMITAHPGGFGGRANAIMEGIRAFDQKAARQMFVDAIRSHSKEDASLWEKTIGTQYAKAERHPEFRPVFDRVQDFIKDTSIFANAAADKAPHVLPSLDGWRDAFRKGTPKADIDAAAKALFTGTLRNERYTQAELRAQGLTERQIGIYGEARAAVEQSLDDAFRAEVVRLAGKNGALMAPAVMQSKTAQDAADLMRDHLTSIGDGDTPKLITEKLDKIKRLKKDGYFPLSRFGEHTLLVKDEAGDVHFFGMYDTSFAANRMERHLQSDPAFKGMEFVRGKMNPELHKLFQGMTPDALEVFAEATGRDADPVYQAYLKLALNNRSALKRLIHRQGIAGFSEDLPRVLAGFITSNARMTAGNLHLGEAKKAALAIPKELGDLQREAVRLIDYVQNPVEEAPAVRALLFTNFIGGSVASAAVNLTQPWTMTLPYLSQFGGIGKAAAHLMAASRMALSDSIPATLKVALDRAVDVVRPQEIHSLQAEVQSGTSSLVRRASHVWGALFSASEQFNRRVTFIAAYQTAQEHGITDPQGFAEKAVIETQGLYNKGNKPDWARGPIGATVMTFKQFSIHYLEFLSRMWRSGPEGKKAAGYAIAILLLTAGAGGLPFAQDLDDALDTIGQALGYDFSAKRTRRKFIADWLGDAAAEVAERGISGVAGVPIDVSLRMGMGNLIPGTGLLLRSNTDRSKDFLEFGGAAGSLAKSATDAAGKLLQGEPLEAGRAVAPMALQNVAKAAEMWNTGQYRNAKGERVMDVTGVDAAAKFFGFQPAEVARESARVGEVTRSGELMRNVQREIVLKWAQGLEDGDPAKVQEARSELRSWNEQNPDESMRMPMQSVINEVRRMRETRADRTLRRAPPALREQSRETLGS